MMLMKIWISEKKEVSVRKIITSKKICIKHYVLVFIHKTLPLQMVFDRYLIQICIYFYKISMLQRKKKKRSPNIIIIVVVIFQRF